MAISEICDMLEIILDVVLTVLALVAFGFGVYEFVNGEVTNALLALILGVLAFKH